MWTRLSDERLAAQAAKRAARKPRLLGSAAMVLGACGGGYLLMRLTGIQYLDPRSGMVILGRPALRHRPLTLALMALLLCLFAVPVVHILRLRSHRNPRPSDTLICTNCHEAQGQGTAACTECGGTLEPLDRWEWVEEEPRA